MRAPLAAAAAAALAACAPVGPHQRAMALEGLLASGRAEDRAAVVAALDDPSWKVAATAAQALARRPAPGAEAPLVKAARTRPEWELRAHAVAALGACRGPPVVEALLEELRGEARGEVREEAVTALAAQGDPDLAVPLVAAAADQSPAVRTRAAEAVKRLAPRSVDLGAGLAAAAAVAARQKGEVGPALAFWAAWLAPESLRRLPLPRTRAELERVTRLAWERERAARAAAEAPARPGRPGGPSREALAAEAQALREAARAAEAQARLDEARRLLEAGAFDPALERLKEAERLGAQGTELRQLGAAGQWAALGGAFDFALLSRLATRWGVEHLPPEAQASYRAEQQRRADEEAQRQEVEFLRQASHCLHGYATEDELAARPLRAAPGACVAVSRARVVRRSSAAAGLFELPGRTLVHLTFPGPAPVKGGEVRDVEATLAGTFPYTAPGGARRDLPRLVVGAPARPR